MFMHENDVSAHEKGGGQMFIIMYGNILFVYDDVIFMHENDIFMHGNSCPCMKFPCHDFCIQKTLRTGSCVSMYMYVYVNVAVSSTCTCIRTSALMAGWSTALPMTARCLSPLLVVPFVRCFYQLSIRHTLCTV